LPEIWIVKAALITVSFCFVLAVLEASRAISADAGTQPARSSIPYVATRNDAVQNMLWMADVGKDDVVYDLGSGDGRIAIAAVRDFGARRAVGIEIDPKLVQESRENARKAKVADRVEFIQSDLFGADIHEATVITLFLGHAPNLKLRPKIFRVLKPGTRIVSHQFGMGEWPTDKTLTVRTVFLGMYSERWNPFRDNPRVPDYTSNEMHFGTSDKISTWMLPAPVAGAWKGKVETAQGPQDCQLTLHQRLSEVTGTLQVLGQDKMSGSIHADLWGDHLRFALSEYGFKEFRFDGRVNGNMMRGSLANGQPGEHAWEAKREKVDLAGKWEWPCLSGSRPVRLRIERRDAHLVAAYVDRNKEVPITDFYDCGGGFYFTLLIGREGDNGLSITEDTGWLIGEGVLDHGKLKGTIEFYPYSAMPGPGGKKTSSPMIRNWAPRLVAP
jgi:SAM-dependent methyltransferase